MRDAGKIFILIGILAAGGYIVASYTDFSPSSGKEETVATNERARETHTTQPSQTLANARCVPGKHPDVSPQSLLELRSRAREMAGEKHFTAALTEFRRIEAIDPGFPGLNLDMSTSLLQLKQTEEAKAAIEAQLAVSECLEKLPPDEFEAYCKAELFQGTADGCRQHLQDIRQSAHLEAALVQIELGHAVRSPSTPLLTEAPAAEDQRAQPAQARTTAMPQRASALQPRTTTAKKPWTARWSWVREPMRNWELTRNEDS